jgi:translation initiation factor IF-2
MGHVDHGKTSLLDFIRSAKVAAGEAGGITQHIGAYHVETPRGIMTFLDTPGHEAFTAMRARGAKATDVVVLVVAADDGVMPQTEEAIAHAKAAGVPIVVALNKIDKKNANPMRVRQQLAGLGLADAQWGGKTEIVETSAVTRQGISALIETLALEAEVLDLKANPKRAAAGVILEARRSEGKGILIHALIQNGTLNRGDSILAGRCFGRVRAIHDYRGRNVPHAGPATPVEITGLSEIPDAGDRFYVVADVAKAKLVAENRARQAVATKRRGARSHISLESLSSLMREGKVKEIKLILKADVQGSLEVLRKALADLATSEVKLALLHSATGGITTSDIELADVSDAIVLGFNIVPEEKARGLAEEKGVDVRTYQVIYHMMDDMRNAMEGVLDPEEKENVLGHVEIRQIFKISKIGTIAGCFVKDGKIERNNKIRLVRQSVIVHTGELDSLKRFKNDVREVAEGFECGLKLKSFDDIKVGDVVEAYEIQKIARKLQETAGGRS